MASFQINEDQENQMSNIRLKTKQSVIFPGKRPALGTITLQSTNICQNQKAKLKPIVSNACTKTNKAVFYIHEDKNEKEKKPEPPIKLTKADKVANKENKENVIPDCVTVLSRKPFQELLLVNKEEKEDEAMSEENISCEEDITTTVDRRICVKASNFLLDVNEYRDDIFKYLLQIEGRNRPRPNYMHRQPDISYSMRTILVDWLVEVGEEYKLHTETLHIAVYIIDRFLSLMSVVRAKLQLLGTAAMFVASKYEEIYPPDISEFTYITDDTYKKKQVLRMEHLILKVLMFDISVPTCLSFVQIIFASCAQNSLTNNLALYLCELTLLEGDPYLQFAPSKIACSAIALARNCLDFVDPWSTELEQFTGYNMMDLFPSIQHLNVTHSNAASLTQQAVQNKYKSSKWQRVSDIQHKPLIIVKP